jgi:transcriptional regulator with XRE-family HTH domain
MITPAQIKAARALVGWKQADLAKAAKLSLTALNNIERGEADPKSSTLLRIQQALEAAGIEFMPRGARLREQPAEAKAS